MARWQVSIAIDSEDPQPIFLQISRGVASDIRRGRLRAGDRLPSSRGLARTLGVHRNTVLSAYAELTAEGWIFSEAGKGMFVSKRLPETRTRRSARLGASSAAPKLRPGFDIAAPISPPRPRAPAPEVVSLMGGLPDLRLVPVASLARAYRRALQGQGRDLLDYGSSVGHLRLRRSLLGMLTTTRGVVAEEDGILVTRGSQMGIYLLARTVLSPGESIAVEAYGYHPAWEAFRLAGVKLVPVPVDRDGMRLDALEKAVIERSCRAVYVTPHHQYPTTVTLSPGRRIQLLELARRHRFAIIEDDYDHEFHYEGRPVLPMASVDVAGVVIYLGTLSKVLAPGLRVGYVVAPPPLIARLSSYRSYVDHVGDQAMEVAVADLIEEGELQRHINRARRIYQKRRDRFVALLQSKLGDVLSFQAPQGGMALWAKVHPSVDVDAWAQRSLDRGVAFAPASRFTFDGRKRPYVRLGFARVDEEELECAVDVLARAT